MSKTVEVAQRWLLVPSSLAKDAARHRVKITAGDETLHHFDLPVSIGDEDPDWWPAIDLSAFVGRRIEIHCLAESVLRQLRFADARPDTAPHYGKALRPRFHFSCRLGWLNDPNGLVFYRGEYHLFYQHNPYFTEWGNMHWGHAVSKDLVHWRELDIALYPDATGAMFSGCAVVDRKNTSGLGDGREPPLVVHYTAASDYSSQCVAYSRDGRSLTKFPGNPVLPQIRAGNRDPKVFRDEARDRWVMVVYVPEPTGLPGCDRHTIEFWSSPDLLRWKQESVSVGGTGDDKFLFECPDFFPLPVNGDPADTLWVLLGANAEYQVGEFNGSHFRPLTGKLRSIHGNTAYAGQTYSDEPKGRRVLVEWMRAASHGMVFNQCMSVPLALSLRRIGKDYHLACNPIEELESLRRNSRTLASRELREDEVLLEVVACDAFDLELRVSADSRGELAVDLASNHLRFHPATGALVFAGERILVPGQTEATNLRILGDRTTIEVFAGDGLVSVLAARAGATPDDVLTVRARLGSVRVESAAFHEMASVWTAAAPELAAASHGV